jgi:hypothetical protein
MRPERPIRNHAKKKAPISIRQEKITLVIVVCIEIFSINRPSVFGPRFAQVTL